MQKRMVEEIILPDWFYKAADEIYTMRVRGAGKIARFTAETINKLAQDYNGTNLDELGKILKDGVQVLVKTRPTAISLKNALRLTLQEANGNNVTDFKNSINNESQKFIQNSLNAIATIGMYGAKRVKTSDALLTHCNSSAALSVIIEAHKEGKNIRAFATESRPWNQGFLTVKDLSDKGIDVTLIVDSAVRHIIKDERINAVFVGADTVCSSGTIVNKIGTSQIALVADEARIPFYVCAETYKFSPESLEGEMVKIEERDASEITDPKKFPNVKFRNPVFDATPAEYIDAIITEKGVIAPSAAYEVIKKEFKEGNEWNL